MKIEIKFKDNIIKFDKIHHREELNEFLKGIDIKPPFIVKPNWISEDYGHFTDPIVLTWLLEFLSSKGQVVLTESYSARNSFKSPPINSKRLGEDDLVQIRKSEDKFLAHTGILSTLQDLDIEYINVTEEILSQENVEPSLVQKQIESLYGPIYNSELYSFVPKKLYALRHGTFINLAKFKVFFSMCIKNTFGMIPEYVGYGSRAFYHGKADKDLTINIIDINKIYRALFRMVGFVEGINSLTCDVKSSNKTYKSIFGYEYLVSENDGLIYYSNEPHWLDAFIHQQSGKNPSDTDHLRRAAEVFGKWPSRLLKLAKNMPTSYISQK